MSDQHFSHYQALLGKVETFHQALLASYTAQITCRLGCHDCCSGDLTFLPIEFHYLLRGLQKIDPSARGTIASRLNIGAGNPAVEPCILLHRRGCALYEFRPLMCRTHGFPLVFEEGDTEVRDCCPKNFVTLPLARLPREALLDLNRLNTILIAVNLEFASRLGIDPGARIPLIDLFATEELPRSEYRLVPCRHR
jgi:Fe-S-cluster containining protein